MISFDIDDQDCILTVTGHAGFGDIGKDIICAGASMLFFAFAEAERKAGRIMEIKADPGDCMLKWRKCHASSRRLEVLEAGAELLARQYPDYVTVSYGEKTKEVI